MDEMKFKQEKEGVIKFKYELLNADSPAADAVSELETVRSKLFQMKLIGEDETGLGYGNVSRLIKKEKIVNAFIITGSQTGGLSELSADQYCKVIDYDYERFWIRAEGKIKPSSEALTHASLYDADPEIHWIIHVHNNALWNFMLKNSYTSTGKIEYGTKEMAEDVNRLLRKGKLAKGNLLAMTGHESGLISFGRSSTEAMEYILQLIKAANL